MNKDDLQKKLENLDRPELSRLQHQLQLKLSILSAKRSAWTALWLLLIPFVILAGAALILFQYRYSAMVMATKV